MNKKLLFLILLGVLVLPITTLAQVVQNVTITGIAVNVANVIWIVATIIVVMFWVVTGVLFLMAAGDPAKLGTAKKALFAAIGGTVIVILAWSVVGIISSAIFRGV